MQCRRYIAKAFRIKRPKSLFFILNRALFSSQIPGDISLLGKVGLKNIIQVHPLCFSFFFFLLTSCQVSSWKGNAVYLATKRRKLDTNTLSNRNNPIKSINIFFKKHLDNLKSSIFNSFSLSAKNAILILTFMYAHFKCRVVVEALTKIHAVPTLIATLSSSKLISSSLSFG